MSKYRVTVNIMLDLSVEGDETFVTEQVAELMKKSLIGQDIYKLQIKTSKLREKRKTLQLGKLPVHEVLPFIRCDDSKKEFQIDNKTYKVRMNSQRYFIFRESTICAACGLDGTVMILEQNPHDKHPHFNLYGVEDGKYILMTKDHILPRAFGGQDLHSNYQTMCSICNGLKGSENISLEGIKELRRILKDNVTESKTKLNELLNEARVKHVVARSEKRIPRFHRKRYYARRKGQEKHLVTNIDMNIWLLTNIDMNIWLLPCGTLVAKSVYEQPPQDGVQIACMKEGTCVNAVGDDGGGRVAITLSEDQKFFVSQGYIDYKDNRPC